MWSYLTPANLIDLQRQSAIRMMGEQARTLLAQGYAADADRVLDEINVRIDGWSRGAAT